MNYPTRVIQGTTATVGGCPEGTIQRGLYRVLQLQWVVVQRELSNTGYTGCYSYSGWLSSGNHPTRFIPAECYSYSGWLSRGNYPTWVIQGVATVDGYPEATIQHGLNRVLHLQWVAVQRKLPNTGLYRVLQPPWVVVQR